MELLAIPLLLAVGALLAVQAAANVQLAAATGNPFGASTLQLAIGAALLLAATLIAGSLGALGDLDRAEPWHLVGGLGSAIYITSGIALFPRLGAVLTVGLWIAGQMLASLALDGFGWLGVDAAPLTAPKLAGGLAVLAGVGLIVRAADGSPAGAPRAGWLALAVLAGAALPVQAAVNAELRADLDATIPVSLVSFLVATTGMALLLVASLSRGTAPRPRVAPLKRMPWWGWLGGLAGAVYVTSLFELVPEIGAAAAIALTVGGQQAASVLVDRYGLLRLPRRPVPPLRVAGVGALLAGVVLIQLA
jgi:bacterial/archaeal transporter family-2 protein